MPTATRRQTRLSAARQCCRQRAEAKKQNQKNGETASHLQPALQLEQCDTSIKGLFFPAFPQYNEEN
jgi:hypothetical protein